MLLSVFSALNDGLNIIGHALKVCWRHPKFLVPLICCWLVYAPLILYLRYGFPWERVGTVGVFLVAFGFLFVLSFVFTLSCLVLLEMIQQIETGNRPSLFRATAHAVLFDLWKSLPIVFVWAILWFLLTILSAIFSRRRDSDDEGLDMESAARTLAGEGFPLFSLRTVFRLLNKALRMVVFLILPAIAWMDCGPLDATRRGLAALKLHLGRFAAGFALSEAVALIVGLPLAIVFGITESGEVTLPDYGWLLVILYSAFAWSFIIYIEQMYAAELFLWHLKWCRKSYEAAGRGHSPPKLSQVPAPSLLDDVPDLINV